MPIKSDFPDVQLSVSDIWSFLFDRKDREFPDNHIIFQSAETVSRQYTFAQLRQSSVDFGKGLNAVYDFRQGDVLGLFAPNDIDVPSVVLGTLWAGGIVSPANRGYTVAELVYQLKDSGAKALCTHFSVLDTARKAAREVGVPESKIFLLGEQKDESIDPKTDLAFLVYSSGTTGRPKGVRLTHFNMTSNIEQIHSAEGWLTWNGTSTPPNSDIPLPAYIVPPIVLLLYKHPVVEKYDLSSLRITNSGAAPLTRELVEGLYARKGVKVKQGYGLSETAPTILMQRWEEWRSAVGTTGVMAPNLEAKFCAVPGSGEESDGTKELPRGKIGELYVRGPNVFSGYHNNPSATAECLEDGWFRTGDVGFLDDRGNVTITDRVKELIKYKGYLASHPLIDDVAVVGVESQALGTEVPRAYIVRKGGLSAVRPGDAQEIIAWMNAKVANHKKLRGGVKFVDAVPKSVSGKILRRVLKERAKGEFREEEEQAAAKGEVKTRAKL
ncbi:putative 4-coumarate-CoA ligase 2 [Exophiala dermatitidis]